MNIEVQNNVPNVKVSVNQNADGSFTIMLAKEITGSKTLGSVKTGDTVTIGDREYIVLRHGEETTAIIAKKPTKFMAFGEDSNYAKSDIRAYCNGEFYEELCKAVGEYNVLPHAVNLVADDDSNKGAGVTDFVSILTCDLYRRYREFLPAILLSMIKSGYFILKTAEGQHIEEREGFEHLCGGVYLHHYWSEVVG